jgi:hypothetical protein
MSLSLLLTSLIDGTSPSFYTLETLFSAAGATAAVFTVTSVLHGFFQAAKPKWFALFFSWLLTLLGISVHHEAWTPANIFLAVINGVVIYAAAVGINNMSTWRDATREATERSYRWWQ